jgi:hypothetical protein
MIEKIGRTERMGGAMMTGEMVAVMKEGMIEDHRRILGKRMLKIRRLSGNGS